MTKYYKKSFLLNLIPIVTTYILLYGETGDNGSGRIFIWFSIPIWAILYLPYLKLKNARTNTISSKILIYFPSLFAFILCLILTVVFDEEMLNLLRVILILVLPTFLYNIYVDLKLNAGESSKIKDKCLLIIKPILLYVILYFALYLFYTPKFYSENVFSIGIIESSSSLNSIQEFLQNPENKFSVPDSIMILPSPESQYTFDEFDHFIYFKDAPIEVVHIKIEYEYADKPYIEIKGTKNLKEKYTWQWQTKMKKNDIEALRVLNRIDNVIKEINPKLETVIKINEP